MGVLHSYRVRQTQDLKGMLSLFAGSSLLFVGSPQVQRVEATRVVLHWLLTAVASPLVQRGF